ncbi:hypothetical protein L6R53_32875 [Myxococcota bacterium]|nr:hypothetical protein [Myxococcota bacterium]
MALNTVNFFELEEGGKGEVRYGPYRELLSDLGRLGVSVARHPGRLQLLLNEVLSLGRGMDKAELEPDWMDVDALHTRMASSLPLTSLLTLVGELRATNQSLKLQLTMLSLGGGSSAASHTFASAEDGRTYGKPLVVLWSEAFKDQVVVDPVEDVEVSFNRATPAGAPSLATWDRESLDPRNPYKRQFYRRFAQALGRWFEEHAAELEPYIEGIEIANEAEIRQVVVDDDRDYPDGTGWGALYYHCAAGFREACDWLPLWLPALASYVVDDGSGAAEDWQGKVAYLRAMLAEIKRLRDRDLTWTGGHGGGVAPRFEMSELVSGIDLHWYHAGEADRRRLLFLPAELAALREELTSDDLEFATVPQISVCETAVNVLCDGADRPGLSSTGYTAGCEAATAEFPMAPVDWRPPRYRVEGDRAVRTHVRAPANDYQGAMVWQRAAAMAVGRASHLGWHTHVARLPSSPFAGTGLRTDFHDSVEPIGVSIPRASWFAYQRLAGVMASVTNVQRLWPVLAGSRGDLANDLKDGELGPDQLVWVVELQGATHTETGTHPSGPNTIAWPSLGGWAYLLYIDGVTGAADDAIATPTAARVTFFRSGLTNVYEVQTGPSSLEVDTSDAARASNTFPEHRWIVAEGLTLLSRTIVSGGSEYTIDVALGAWPRLIFCEQRLGISSVTVLASSL